MKSRDTKSKSLDIALIVKKSLESKNTTQYRVSEITCVIHDPGVFHSKAAN